MHDDDALHPRRRHQPAGDPEPAQHRRADRAEAGHPRRRAARLHGRGRLRRRPDGRRRRTRRRRLRGAHRERPDELLHRSTSRPARRSWPARSAEGGSGRRARAAAQGGRRRKLADRRPLGRQSRAAAVGSAPADVVYAELRGLTAGEDPVALAWRPADRAALRARRRLDRRHRHALPRRSADRRGLSGRRAETDRLRRRRRRERRPPAGRRRLGISSTRPPTACARRRRRPQLPRQPEQRRAGRRQPQQSWPASAHQPGRPAQRFDAGARLGVTAVAYTNAFGQSLLPADDGLRAEPTANKLFLQNPPNAGTLTDGRLVTLGGAPLDFGPRASLDLPPDVRVTTSNAAATGSAVALPQVGGVTGLYRLELATGAAVALGATPPALSGIAVGRVWGTPPDPPAGSGPGSPGGGDPGPAPAAPRATRERRRRATEPRRG